jgi:5-methylcytosine-specific restriction endonuclease McrA
MQGTPAPRICSVGGCDNPIQRNNVLGRCGLHRAKHWVSSAPECREPECGKILRRNNRSGLCRQHCGDWQKAYNREYYRRNQADLVEYARQYREDHLEEHRAASRAWAAANPEARQAAHARERQLARQRKLPWKQQIDWYRRIMERRRRIKADMDATDRLLSALYREAIKGDSCFYCGSPVTHHVDHFFPLAKGGTDHWFNLVRSCQRCNLRKQAQCGTAFILRGRL